jgi:hypothetical protein
MPADLNIIGMGIEIPEVDTDAIILLNTDSDSSFVSL